MTVPTSGEDDAGHDAVRWVLGRAAPRCRNCGSASGGRYCPACGQTTELHPPTVAEFVHGSVTHNVALEEALWRTLHALVIRPGLLTTEYFAGRRARYIAPLRLYLTFTIARTAVLFVAYVATAALAIAALAFASLAA